MSYVIRFVLYDPLLSPSPEAHESICYMVVHFPALEACIGGPVCPRVSPTLPARRFVLFPVAGSSLSVL